MNLSYREKSLWVSLLAIVVVALYFGNSVWAHLTAGDAADTGAVTAVLLKTVVAVIVIEVILHILLAMDSQEGVDEPEDERERQLRYKANEIGYWLLSIGVIGCVVQQLIHQQLLSMGEVPESDAYVLLSMGSIELKLVVVFWISEIVRFASHIYYYRKDDLA